MRAKRPGANGNKGETTQGANGNRGGFILRYEPFISSPVSKRLKQKGKHILYIIIYCRCKITHKGVPLQKASIFTDTTVGKPRTDSVPPTMQSQIPKSRDVTLFFLDMTLYKWAAMHCLHRHPMCFYWISS